MYKDWKSVLINGKHLSRIKYTSSNSKELYCRECNTSKNSLHVLSCSLELCPCGLHKYLVECNCPIREGEDV